MSDNDNQEFSPQTQRQTAAVMLDAVDVFYRLRERLPASYIGTFLKIATNEGLSVSELAIKCGVSGAVMSRHLGELGTGNRRGGAGLDLVAVVQRATGIAGSGK